MLRNDDGRFTDITEMSGNVLMGPGMVTDCEFADMDGDKDLDLVLVGEWMPVSVFRNTQGVFFNATEELGFTGSNGWWSSLAVADMDGDGDNDLVTGNLGWNSKFKADKEHPLHVYWADFDGNGRSDIVLSKEKDGKKLPVRGRECSSQQCPTILEKFHLRCLRAQRPGRHLLSGEALIGFAPHRHAHAQRDLDEQRRNVRLQAVP